MQVGFKTADKMTRKKIRDSKLLSGQQSKDNLISGLIKMSKKYGFEAHVNKDYGFGSIDLVWNIKFHPRLDPLRVGFVKLKEQEGGSSHLEDGQFSLRKIEEATMLALRSGMDRVYLVCDNEDIAKSVRGQIQWLSSFGSIINLGSYASGVFPGQDAQKK